MRVGVEKGEGNLTDRYSLMSHVKHTRDNRDIVYDDEKYALSANCGCTSVYVDVR